MPLTVEAVYENGVLKPTQPLPLKEHETLRVTIEPRTNWVQESAGILKWNGTPEDLQRFAEDPELAFPPPSEGP
jgi:predicted DNA-binding antitoxin AbrB/MazE fold protein